MDQTRWVTPSTRLGEVCHASTGLRERRPAVVVIRAHGHSSSGERQLEGTLDVVCVVPVPPPGGAGICVRVSGDAVAVAGRIFTTFPALLPNPWRDGPEGGLSTDIEAGATTLSVVPRGDAQALLVLQPGTAAVAPAAAPLPAFTIDNPTGSYFVILDGDQPVRDPAALKPGHVPHDCQCHRKGHAAG